MSPVTPYVLERVGPVLRIYARSKPVLVRLTVAGGTYPTGGQLVTTDTPWQVRVVGTQVTLCYRDEYGRWKEGETL